MPYTNEGKHRMLNHLAGNVATHGPVTHMGLHTAQPSTSTPNEVSGGSPSYSRQAIAFEAAAGTEQAGSVDVSTQPVFNVPGGTTVSHVGFWTASSGGTLLAWAAVTNESFGAQGTYTVTDADLHLNL